MPKTRVEEIAKKLASITLHVQGINEWGGFVSWGYLYMKIFQFEIKFLFIDRKFKGIVFEFALIGFYLILGFSKERE